jgi:hypothetical protein
LTGVFASPYRAFGGGGALTRNLGCRDDEPILLSRLKMSNYAN